MQARAPVALVGVGAERCGCLEQERDRDEGDRADGEVDVEA